MHSRSSALADRGAELRVLAAMLALALLLGLMPRNVDGATGDPVLLNEALVSHTGVDTTEYVELFGVPGTSLAGISLVSVEGDSSTTPGTIDRRVDFPTGSRLGGNGFYLVGNPVGLAASYRVTPDLSWGNDSLENGSQTLALVSTAGLGASGTVVTGGETVVDAVALTDGGATDQWFWSAPLVGPDDGFLPGGARRLADGVDTDAASDWVFADDLLGPTNTPTPSTPYNAPPVADCGTEVIADEGTAADGSLSATDPDGRVTAFAAAVSPDPGTVGVLSVVAAASDGGMATATLHVADTTPPGTYAVTVTASNDDMTPQTADCDLQVTVNDLPDPTPEPTPVPPSPPSFSTAGLRRMANHLGGDKVRLVTQRLERIDQFMAGGQQAAAAAQLLALANQVMGLSPRWISADDAQAMATEAEALRSALAT
jgi:hypothetical protein